MTKLFFHQVVVLATCSLSFSSAACRGGDKLASDAPTAGRGVNSSGALGCESKAHPARIVSVVAEAAEKELLPAPGPSQIVLSHDPKATDPRSVEPKRFVLLDPGDTVPIMLKTRPRGIRQKDGRMLVEVELRQAQATQLEDFTRRHLGQRVALVLDDYVISVHKVRAVITGGKIMITRCTDNACEIIFSKLSKTL